MNIDNQGNLYLGDTRLGDRLATQEEIAAFEAARAALNRSLTVVSMRQARLALLQAGLLDDVEAAINALPEPQRAAARIEWDYSSQVARTQPLVLQLAPALGLNEAQLDALFVTARAL
ncbi:MAG: hypothetical protein E6Q97_13090 [Desulfurellales bacterium]|nr:MAG: hypothetical protein E6Q97_13090 [Desulfurellales bacterium]